MKKLAKIEDNEEGERKLSQDAANAAEQRQAAIEQRPARKLVARTTKDICRFMTQDGWISCLLADVVAEYHPWYPYDGSKSESETLFSLEPFMVRASKYSRQNKAFYQTRTYQAWRTGQQVPILNTATAVSAVLRYEDPNREYECNVLVGRKEGLLCAEYEGKTLVGFLEDFSSKRFSYSFEQALPVSDIDVDEISAREGAVLTHEHLRRERDRDIIIKKRQQVLDATGCLACGVCGFDFHLFYGEIGLEFCEVHHLTPLADASGEVDTRLADLAIVCSNCHRMLHRNRPFLTIEQLKARIRLQSQTGALDSTTLGGTRKVCSL